MFRRRKKLVVQKDFDREFKMFCYAPETQELFMIDSVYLTRAEYSHEAMRNTYTFTGAAVTVRQIRDWFELKREVGL